jgi:hypothetical protein
VTELREDTGPDDGVPAAARERPRPAETAERSRAETMTREEYADHIRHGPAADRDDQYAGRQAGRVGERGLGERAQA